MTTEENAVSVISGKDISKLFVNGKTRKMAVNHVDFAFHSGEVISIVGESGSGKTTLAKIILGLEKNTSGEITYNGKPRDISSSKKCSASDTIYIMKDGQFVEKGFPDDVILNPQMDYTKRLISDVPKIHSRWDFAGKKATE